MGTLLPKGKQDQDKCVFLNIIDLTWLFERSGPAASPCGASLRVDCGFALPYGRTFGSSISLRSVVQNAFDFTPFRLCGIRPPSETVTSMPRSRPGSVPQRFSGNPRTRGHHHNGDLSACGDGGERARGGESARPDHERGGNSAILHSHPAFAMARGGRLKGPAFRISQV